MHSYSNTDRIDEQARNTKYPFAWTSTLAAAGTVMPVGAFKCVLLHMAPDKTPPAHISKASIEGTAIVLTFSDFNAVKIGTLRMEKDSAFGFVRDSDGVIAGHCVWLSSAYVYFTAVVQLAGGTIVMGSGDFQLLPECHKAILTGNGKVVYMGDTPITSSVTLDTDSHSAIREEDGAFVVHLFGDPPDISVSSGIQTINGIAVGGRHLLLSSAPLSDVRITVESGQVQIKGVLDVD